MAATFWKRL